MPGILTHNQASDFALGSSWICSAQAEVVNITINEITHNLNDSACYRPYAI
jgi:hypothetical protein